MDDDDKKKQEQVGEKKYHYKQLLFWVQQYGIAGTSDQRAVETFIDCETTEAINMLRNELIGVSHGNYQDEVFDLTVGVKRRMRHSSYQEWARLMLLWMASYKH